MQNTIDCTQKLDGLKPSSNGARGARQEPKKFAPSRYSSSVRHFTMLARIKNLTV